MSKCETCYWNDKCRYSNIGCDDYTPLTPKAEDEVLYERIESERQEYFDAYIEYISEYEDIDI